MHLSRPRMLERMMARDAAADGRFVTGVTTTGIYCLPSCPARKPRPENVTFFPSPAAAREAGLRPCRRCRPDDFWSGVDRDEERAAELVASVRAAPESFGDSADLARAAGVGLSKLHALLRTHYHQTPGRLLSRARVDRAAELLVAGSRRVSDIAWDVGFDSLSAFNEAFRRQMAMSPTAYRALLGARGLALRLPASFPSDALLTHLGRDGASVTERVEANTWVAALEHRGAPLTVDAVFRPGRVEIALEGPGAEDDEAPVAVHRRLLARFGLAGDAAAFEAQIAADPALEPLTAGRRGLAVPRLADPFEALVWTVVGQQVTLVFARALFRELAGLAGLAARHGLRTPPAAARLAEVPAARLEAIRLSRRKSQTLLFLAAAVARGELDLTALAAGPAPRAERRLLAVHGLGPWSAGYLLLRAFGFEDAVPWGDAGLARGLRAFFGLAERPSRGEAERLMAPFTPHRGLATFHLWHHA